MAYKKSPNPPIPASKETQNESLEEAIELGLLIRRVSAALKTVTGCRKTYVVQFAEAAEHPHVHVHVIPRMADQPEDRRGPQIFAYLGVSDAERVSEDTMNEIGAKVRQALHQFDFSGKTE